MLLMILVGCLAGSFIVVSTETSNHSGVTNYWKEQP